MVNAVVVHPETVASMRSQLDMAQMTKLSTMSEVSPQGRRVIGDDNEGNPLRRTWMETPFSEPPDGVFVFL